MSAAATRSGSGRIDQSQKMTVVVIQIADSNLICSPLEIPPIQDKINPA
ncbi:hypothetical protein CUJ84_Chr000892 [Rhizobium leguminosarum]|uniref:Uncharacterized protein n=1 Tax=Rhizobium leguminosarum TaxID=384 RepID=A0A2K9YZ81_RHILE|nr:hypothetical protein CUJ84_Chr000892 [Rhizobium leguminosarum]